MAARQRRNGERYAVLPFDWIADRRLSPAEFRMLAAIAVHDNPNHGSWASHTLLAEIVGTSRPAVVRTIGRLVELGYLTVERRRNEATGRQAPSVYKLKRRAPAAVETRSPEYRPDTLAQSPEYRGDTLGCTTGAVPEYQNGAFPEYQGDTRNITKEQTREQTKGNSTPPAPRKRGADSQPRNGDVEQTTNAEPLTPPTDADRELWIAARAWLTDDWSKVNREKAEAIKLVGRGPDRGCRFNVPSRASLVASRQQLAAALVAAGDPYGERADFVECR